MNVRTSGELDRLVADAADRAGLTLSQWVRDRLRVAALEESPRELRVQRRRAFSRVCGHPLQVRTRNNADGVSWCMRCGTEVKR